MQCTEGMILCHEEVCARTEGVIFFPPGEFRLTPQSVEGRREMPSEFIFGVLQISRGGAFFGCYPEKQGRAGFARRPHGFLSVGILGT